MMKNWRRLTCLATFVASLALAGCSSVDLTEPEATMPVVESGSVTSGETLEGQQQQQYANSIYFDFDSYSIKPEALPVIEQHARYLLAHPELTVVIEGNTDIRGSREYNIALGQRRSEAVKQNLQLYGVPAARIESVSFGSEKPRALGNDEASWAENRRADIQYSGSAQ